MANSTASSSSGGIGFCGLLAIVFITLKLLGKIDWTWTWVLAPIWIPFSIVMVILLCVGAAFLVAHLRDK